MKIALTLLTLLVATPAVAQTSAIDLVTKVHNTVNSKLKFKDDTKAGGRPNDTWTIPTGIYGDCEDYALLKKKLLIEAGFNADDIKLLIVNRQGEQKSTKKVIYLHVVAYIPSLNVILDSGSPADANSGKRSKKVDVASYEDWMKYNNATLICEVTDESEGTNVSLNKRCGRNVMAIVSR
jgi:hypothetical protein